MRSDHRVSPGRLTVWVKERLAWSPAQRILLRSLFRQPALTHRSHVWRECRMPSVATPQTNNCQDHAQGHRDGMHEKGFHGPQSYTHLRAPKRTAPKILCSVQPLPLSPNNPT